MSVRNHSADDVFLYKLISVNICFIGVHRLHLLGLCVLSDITTVDY